MFTHSINGKTVITPNERMASQLGKLIASAELKESKSKSVKSPEVMSLNSFVENTYNELIWLNKVNPIKPLESTEVLSFMYFQAINEIQPSDVILDPSELASVAVNAHTYIKNWMSNPTTYTPASIDQEYFLKWFEHVEKQVSASNLAFQWDAIDTICEQLEQGSYKPLENLVLFGFDDTPPIVEKLFTTMKNAGIESSYAWYEKTNETQHYKLAAENLEHQYIDAARVAYNLYKQDKTKKIAIIHPLLHEEARHKKFISALTEVFEPQYILPQTSAYVRPFNITFGDSLSKEPLTAAFLDMLSIFTGTMSSKVFAAFLQSPFWSAQKENQHKQNILSHDIRRKMELNYGINDLVSVTKSCVQLHSQFRKIGVLVQNSSDQMSFKEWVNLFIKTSEILGFGHGRKLNSLEYQTYEKLSDTLEVALRTENMFDNMDVCLAVKLVIRHIKLTVFQPQTDLDAPIQVMGLLEAAGMKFEHSILMHMDDNTFPGYGEPSPFIPLDEQINKEMPHSSPEREKEIATRIVNRITEASDTTTYLFAKLDKELEQEPCYLVKGDDLPTELTKSQDVSYARTEFRSTSMHESPEKIDRRNESQKVKGGVGLVSDALKCQFRATAKHRLNLRAPLPTSQGLTPIEQSNILHHALELFWSEYKAQEALLQMSDEMLSEIITDTVDTALFSEPNVSSITSTLREMELNRMSKLLLQVMEVEKSRPPFIVESVEREATLEVAGIKISYRPDRIDKVDTELDGTYEQRLALDYKRGSVSLTGLGHKLTEAQLPLVAIHNEDNIDGVALFSLRDDEVGITGLGEEGLAPGVEPMHKASYRTQLPNNFEQTKSYWNDLIETEVKTHLSGSLSINPANKSDCDVCEIKSICKRMAN